MSQWITEEQTPHLRLSAEAEEVLYSGESEFQKIEVFKSKEYGTMLALDGVFQHLNVKSSSTMNDESCSIILTSKS